MISYQVTCTPNVLPGLIVDNDGIQATYTGGSYTRYWTGSDNASHQFGSTEIGCPTATSYTNSFVSQTGPDWSNTVYSETETSVTGPGLQYVSGGTSTGGNATISTTTTSSDDGQGNSTIAAVTGTSYTTGNTTRPVTVNTTTTSAVLTKFFAVSTALGAPRTVVTTTSGYTDQDFAYGTAYLCELGEIGFAYTFPEATDLDFTNIYQITDIFTTFSDSTVVAWSASSRSYVPPEQLQWLVFLATTSPTFQQFDVETISTITLATNTGKIPFDTGTGGVASFASRTMAGGNPVSGAALSTYSIENTCTGTGTFAGGQPFSSTYLLYPDTYIMTGGSVSVSCGTAPTTIFVPMSTFGEWFNFWSDSNYSTGPALGTTTTAVTTTSASGTFVVSTVCVPQPAFWGCTQIVTYRGSDPGFEGYYLSTGSGAVTYQGYEHAFLRPGYINSSDAVLSLLSADSSFPFTNYSGVSFSNVVTPFGSGTNSLNAVVSYNYGGSGGSWTGQNWSFTWSLDSVTVGMAETFGSYEYGSSDGSFTVSTSSSSGSTGSFTAQVIGQPAATVLASEYPGAIIRGPTLGWLPSYPFVGTFDSSSAVYLGTQAYSIYGGTQAWTGATQTFSASPGIYEVCGGGGSYLSTRQAGESYQADSANLTAERAISCVGFSFAAVEGAQPAGPGAYIFGSSTAGN